MKFWRVTQSFVEMRVAMVVNLMVHALESHHLRADRLGEVMYDHLNRTGMLLCQN